MSESMDIIGGVNSLNDVFSGTHTALSLVSEDIDALRKSPDKRAQELAAKIQRTTRLMLRDAAILTESPEAIHRDHWAKHANALINLSEDATILLSELETSTKDSPSGSA